MPMQIKSQFTHEKVRFDTENPVHLVLSIEAPKSDWQKSRPTLCVVPVLDISGSMAGAKLDYAKKSLLKLVEHLAPSDYFGLVSFSSRAEVDLEPGLMTPERKEQARKVIRGYATRGCTNFSDGMLLGFELANKVDLSSSTLVRVILFTDGQPTHGVTDPKGLSDLLQKQAGRASVSAFGYGKDACQELLLELSSVGKGNYAFVKDPDSALTAFGKELGGLLSTYAQDLVVEISPSHGHQLTEVLSDVDVEEETTGEVRIKVPNILSEETMHLVAAVKLAARKEPGPRQVNAIDIKLSYKVLSSEGKLDVVSEESKAKVQFVRSGEEQVEPTRAVDEIVARAQLVKAQIVADIAANAGKFDEAQNAFRGLNLHERGHDQMVEISDHIKGLYSPSLYGTSAGNRVGLRCATARAAAACALDPADQGIVQASGYTFSTSAQEELSELFEVNQPELVSSTSEESKVPISKSRSSGW